VNASHDCFSLRSSLEAEEYPTDLVGQLTKEHRFLLKEGGSTLSCDGAGLTSLLASADTALDVDAGYTKCANFIGQQLVVNMNSCSYVFHVANVGPPYSGTAEVACSTPGDAIQFVANPEKPVCIYELLPQELGTATFSTEDSLNARRVTAEVEGTGITYTRTYNGFFCPNASSTGGFSGGFSLGGVE
jgi:hypothetical protein